MISISFAHFFRYPKTIKEAEKENKDQEYLLETFFEDEPGTTHYCPRSNFIDPNGTKNEKFASWEKEHKIIASKFEKGYAPERESEKKPRKTKISSNAVGAILADGRATKKSKTNG